MSRRREIFAAALLIGATLLAYLPALHGGFIFDDDVFLTGNPLIHAPDGLARFWFSRDAADYWPVTSSTLWLEWRLWGAHAAGYHATNLALHGAEALLFWGLLRRLRLPGAFFAALMFALHPVNAESVAWITERKNLMAMLFYLLSLYWFTGETRRGYWLSLPAFALAMLSKGSVVVLPLVLLGLVAWRRRPEKRDLWRLAPFFLVAVALAAIEMQFSTILGSGDTPSLDLLARLLRAAAIVWFYAGKIIWPAGLCFDYGQWKVQPTDLRWWLPLAAGVVTFAVLWHYRRNWGRPALFGCGYFCLAVAPVMGFAEVGFMRFSPVSDHFAHVALAGMAALAGAGLATLAAGPTKRRAVVFGLGATAAIAWGALTWRQSWTYADAQRLYRNTLALNPASWIAQTNLGAMLSDAGQLEPAIAHLEDAVRLKPDFTESRNDLGLAFYRSGRFADAMLQYGEALRLRPDFYQARNNLGAVLAQTGRLGDAITQFRTALQIQPDYREAQVNLARAEQIERDTARPR